MANPVKRNTQTVTLKSGDRYVLPKGAVIVDYIKEGNIELTSSCDDLPEPTFYKCWRFIWENVNTSYNDAYFTSIEINGVKYPLTNVNNTNDPKSILLGYTSEVANTYDNGGVYLPLAIPLAVPVGMVKDITTRGGTAVDPKCIKLSIPAGMGQPILYWTNPTTSDSVLQLSAMIAEENQCACP